jgi:hypothetical protein
VIPVFNFCLIFFYQQGLSDFKNAYVQESVLSFEDINKCMFAYYKATRSFETYVAGASHVKQSLIADMIAAGSYQHAEIQQNAFFNREIFYQKAQAYVVPQVVAETILQKYENKLLNYINSFFSFAS